MNTDTDVILIRSINYQHVHLGVLPTNHLGKLTTLGEGTCCHCVESTAERAAATAGGGEAKER